MREKMKKALKIPCGSRSQVSYLRAGKSNTSGAEVYSEPGGIMRHAVVVCICLFLMATGPAAAQETTGRSPGERRRRGRNADRRRRRGGERARWARSSPHRTARVANRFPRLAPGTYTVAASVEGLPRVEAEAVRVILGEAVTIDFTLHRGTFEDEIQVYSDTVVIDFAESQTSTSIRQREIDYLPRGRDFTDVVTFAAGAIYDNQGGGIMIDGATGLENRFVIDGINTTDPEIGQSSVPMRAEFMEEVQVKSAGYTAEYGGAIGGVINAVTRSGSNEFHGGVFVDIENNDWNGSARPQLERSPCTRCEFDDGTWESPSPGTRTTRCVTTRVSSSADRSCATGCGSSPRTSPASAPRNARSTG